MNTIKKDSGFTLVELVIVIAIIGILAAIAIPKFVNLSTTAQTNSTLAIAGALASGASTNYAVRKLSATFGSAITNCTSVANTLQGGLPSGYTITSAALTVDAPSSCTLQGPNSTSATFIATGIT